MAEMSVQQEALTYNSIKEINKANLRDESIVGKKIDQVAEAWKALENYEKSNIGEDTLDLVMKKRIRFNENEEKVKKYVLKQNTIELGQITMRLKSMSKRFTMVRN